MDERPGPAYGTPNFEMIGRWLQIDSADDGPFWALNLMKYHAEARYDDGTTGVSGREADDAYAPLGPLAAVGAAVAFVADVVDQPLGAPGWDRIGIVRYPSRAAFFAMQQRDDFQAQHVHKEAGMEFTIVMSCLPVAHDVGAPSEGSLVLVADRGAGDLAALSGVAEVAGFDVEGVIVGDDRTFERARVLRVADGAFDALVDAARVAEEVHVVVLNPTIDLLLPSIISPA
ncbi:MAG: hypothetical protein Q8K72_01240, partial [Acidimicrobiales bacterium]|nr:hypothetical protein [Acidimicrobiales bacterium]